MVNSIGFFQYNCPIFSMSRFCSNKQILFESSLILKIIIVLIFIISEVHFNFTHFNLSECFEFHNLLNINFVQYTYWRPYLMIGIVLLSNLASVKIQWNYLRFDKLFYHFDMVFFDFLDLAWNIMRMFLKLLIAIWIIIRIWITGTLLEERERLSLLIWMIFLKNNFAVGVSLLSYLL